MRRLAFSALFGGTRVANPLSAVLLLAIHILPSGVLAQSKADSVANVDTVTTDEESTGRIHKDGSLSIKIDESGIRIEGSMDEDLKVDPRLSASNGSIRYREKGIESVIIGEDLFVAQDELIRGDIVVFGGDVILEGKVVGNVVIMGGDADIRTGAEVNGDVVVIGGVLEEESGVMIYGERVMLRDLSIPIRGLSQFYGSNSYFLSEFLTPINFFIHLIMSFLIVLFLRERVVKSEEHLRLGVIKTTPISKLGKEPVLPALRTVSSRT